MNKLLICENVYLICSNANQPVCAEHLLEQSNHVDVPLRFVRLVSV